MDKRDKYCIEICKGKCCTLYPPGEEPVRCPRQTPDGSCGIYHIRYSMPLLKEPLVQVGAWKSRSGIERPFVCGHIEEIIAQGHLPKHIEEGCCYAHPELLERLGDDNPILPG